MHSKQQQHIKSRKRQTTYSKRNNVSSKQLRSAGRSTKRRNRMHTNTNTFTLSSVNMKPIQQRVFRYENVNTIPNNLSFDIRDMRNLLGFVTAGATTFYPIIDSFRLRRIGLTILPGDSTAGSTWINFSWQGDNAPQVEETMLASNTVPCHMSFFPAISSTAWDWHDDQGSNDALFSLSLNNNSTTLILDIEMEYIINDGAVSSQTLNNASAITGISSRRIPILTEEMQSLGLASVG